VTPIEFFVTSFLSCFLSAQTGENEMYVLLLLVLVVFNDADNKNWKEHTRRANIVNEDACYVMPFL